MSSRGVNSGRETKRGRGELTSMSGNGKFEIQRRPLEIVGWSKGDKFCLRLLPNCALKLQICNF